MITTMKRPRIKHICVASTGNTKTVSLEDQQQMDHQSFKRWYKKNEEYFNNAPSVNTTTVVYNPARHKYAIVWGKKVLIKTEEEYNIYVSSGFTITNH